MAPNDVSLVMWKTQKTILLLLLLSATHTTNVNNSCARLSQTHFSLDWKSRRSNFCTRASFVVTSSFLNAPCGCGARTERNRRRAIILESLNSPSRVGSSQPFHSQNCPRRERTMRIVQQNVFLGHVEASSSVWRQFSTRLLVWEVSAWFLIPRASSESHLVCAFVTLDFWLKKRISRDKIRKKKV